MDTFGGKTCLLFEEEKTRILKTLSREGIHVPFLNLLFEDLEQEEDVLRLREDEEIVGRKKAWESFMETAERKARRWARASPAESRDEDSRSDDGAALSDGSYRAREHYESVMVAGKDWHAEMVCEEVLAQDAAGDPVVEAFRKREFGAPRRTLSPDRAVEYMTSRLPNESEWRHDGSLEDAALTYLVYEHRSFANKPNFYKEGGFGPYRKRLLTEPEYEPTLLEVAHYLQAQYPWERQEAALFVLAGKTPSIEAIRVQEKNDRTVEITVHPWISKKSFDAAYMAMKAVAARSGGGGYTPRKQHLDLVQFVTWRIRPDGKRPPWRLLQEEWNSEHSDRPYRDRGLMSRVYKETRKKLAPRRLWESQR